MRIWNMYFCLPAVCSEESWLESYWLWVNIHSPAIEQLAPCGVGWSWYSSTYSQISHSSRSGNIFKSSKIVKFGRGGSVIRAFFISKKEEALKINIFLLFKNLHNPSSYIHGKNTHLNKNSRKNRNNFVWATLVLTFKLGKGYIYIF